VGIRHCLGTRFPTGISCHREYVFDSVMAVVRRAVSSQRRLWMDARNHARQSAHLWGRCAAYRALSWPREWRSALLSRLDRCDARVHVDCLPRRIGDDYSADHDSFGLMATENAYAVFPLINATLNGTSAVLLLTGRALVAKKLVWAHRRCMIAAVCTSSLFLI